MRHQCVHVLTIVTVTSAIIICHISMFNFLAKKLIIIYVHCTETNALR